MHIRSSFPTFGDPSPIKVNTSKPLHKALGMLVILCLCNSDSGMSLFAEGDEDYRLFLRYADSVVQEVQWKPTEPRLIYEGPPASKEDRYRVIPCLVRMPNGTLVALVEPGGRRPVFIQSTDGGITWSKPYRGELQEGVRTISTLGVGRDGRLMAVSEKPLRLAYSRDDGRSWTAGNAIDATLMARAWVWTGGRLLELEDGTLVLPVAGYLEPDSKSTWLSSAVLLSSDEGTTWSLSVIGHGNPGNMMIFSEPAVAMLDNGGLVALLRTEDRVSKVIPGEPRGERTGLCRANSWDGGKTWSSPVETIPGSHGSVVELPDQVLLCGYHRPPRLALSSDAGRSWYANMLWSVEKPKTDWGWYTVVEVVDKSTAIALIKDMQPYNTIRACFLHRQPVIEPTRNAKDTP
jgi:hypothetical protein